MLTGGQARSPRSARAPLTAARACREVDTFAQGAKAEIDARLALSSQTWQEVDTSCLASFIQTSESRAD
jgi:hypothetical protein